MKNIFKIFTLLFAAMFSANGMAQQMPELPLDPAVRYGKLENGLTYYIRHNAEQKGLADFYIAQKVGAVQEEDSQRGLAHFLEHMCFNGSEHFPGSDDLVKFCEGIGVKFGYNLNAYTACDETVYNISDVPVTAENVEGMFNILYDWAAGLTLPEEEIDKERGVIKEEWRMRNSGAMRIYERALPLLMSGSRYGYRLPIGTMEVVENFPYQELRDYYEKWYRPDLQGIIIVGDINVDELEAKVKDVFGKIKMPENAAPYEFYPVPDNNEAIYVIDQDKELRQASISIYFKQQPLPLELRNTQVGVATNLITSMVCSMLNARLEELSQKPDCNFIGAGAYYDNMVVAKTIDAFTVSISPKPGKDAEAVQEVMQEVQRAVRFGFTGGEKFRAQENIISSLERLNLNRDKQKNETYVNWYVRHFLDNKPAMDIETTFMVYKQFADALPLEAYSQTFAQLAASTDTNFVFFAMYPEKEDVAVPTVDAMKAAVKAAVNAELTPYVDNVKNEPLVPELPAKGSIVKEEAADFGYTKWTLSNGANLYFRQTDFNDAQVMLRAESFGGMSLVKDEDVMNARILREVMNSTGLGNFTAVELQKKLAGKQVSTSVSLGDHMEHISGSATPKDLRTLFELLYLRFQKPANDPDAYANFMSYQRTSLANASKLPQKAWSDSISSTLYPGVERQRPFTMEDLDKMSYEEIKRIYSERFASAGDFNFYVTGAFNLDSLRVMTETYLASLPGCAKREKFVDLGIDARKGVVENRFFREMETPQAFLAQIWHGEKKYTLKDALTVSAFGDVLSQRYLKSIREDGGLSYSVNASASMDYDIKDEYSLQIVCPFTPEKCDSVLLLMQIGIQDIAQKGVTDEELDKIKKFELKQFADSQRENAYWQGLIIEKVEWGKDGQKDYEKIINGLNSKDIQKFVNKTLLKKPNTSTIIMLPATLKP